MSRSLSPEQAQHIEDLYGPLTQSLRRLIDVTIRSEADDIEVAQAHRLIEQAADLLSSRLDPGPFGVRTTTDGGMLPWGNVAIGMRNAIAPPLNVIRDDSGRATVDLVLEAPYEGPAGHVHGGVCALLLDHVLGATAHRPGKPAFTGTLTLRYVAPTRLGKLRVEAWIDSETESKTIAAGHIKDADGVVTVQAEGIFIRPKAKP
ncbi:PaaI family thioesterase [Mycolicibacterium diernhoferi]|uniref:Acyl-coenzyme A thioesterase THEM4 n=1 Tax=Mycolicibacterium diernhoferi TaxID=1801 RepID=A0A1Q4H7S5_9MYCO|nr:PaaI family thioesterase [Mycolicibacterium diernhoferi]OJZ63441.1 thioesterase [Mycolicibacterium diernhoferi]OPE53715.1 thioesterase [Mycolicibacterium diernhoferi]PEG53979.1 PaaI family thioesterase [Mycolicibacterium diernhoferi]QYL20582.1 PaaI family thioesterase [Mycolicibacterium diernhoferi]